MKEELPVRKPLRLKDWDYSTPGTYFITLCTYQKCCSLGSIRRGDPCGRPTVTLTALGQALEAAIPRIERLYGVRADAYVIMPNHMHLLFAIPQEERRATARVAPTTGLVVGGLKSIAVNLWRKAWKETDKPVGPLWQTRYYDHVVRDDHDLHRIQTYIDQNPAKWAEDRYYCVED